MPELPDVEIFKRYFDSRGRHHRVRSVSVRSPRMLRGISPATLRRRLRGRKLISSRRHGKYLLVRLDRDARWLALHFGMTGFLAAYREAKEAPAHPRLVLDLDDGRHLAYDCQRMFGSVGLTRDPQELIEERKLGPDALTLGATAFAERIGSGRGSIKSVLMNQSTLAGIGNVYSDEILFQAKLHPETRVEQLDRRTLDHLHRKLRTVLRAAIRYRADPERVPKSWLLPHRHSGAACPRCRRRLKRQRVSGRAAWLCEGCMKRPY